MTRRQAVLMLVLGGALAGALVLVYVLALPAEVAWSTNRVLHHAWQAVVALAGAGGAVWSLWPRAKARRRDVERERTRRRAIAFAGVVVAAVLLVILVEPWRDSWTRDFLDRTASSDLVTIGDALRRYGTDHEDADPPTLAALVPAYLEREALYYAYREGPWEAPPPPHDAALRPSYVLAPALKPDRGDKPRETRILVYLRPGQAWSPMTILLDRDGAIHLRGEDIVEVFEEQLADQEQDGPPK